MNLKKLIWILISIALIPVGIIIGGIFFGVIAVIVIGIISLFLILFMGIYINRKVRGMIGTIKGTTQEYAEEKTNRANSTERKSNTKRTGNEKEIIIEQIEEKVVEKKNVCS